MSVINDIVKYKEFLKTSIKKEIRGKYKGSILGVLWSFVNPLLQVAVYAIVFPLIMRNTVDNYILFLVSGIIPWTFYLTVVSESSNTIIANAGIIKKVYFPRFLLPVSIVTSSLINFLISCIIIFLLALISGGGISYHLVFLPLIIIIQYILSLGVAFLLSAINVYIRDVQYIVNFFTLMLFYLTPILYPPEFIPAKYSWILYANPIANLMEGYRSVFFDHKVPDMFGLGITLAFSVILLIFGFKTFQRLQRGFAEEL